jgi:hypothetical protein
MLPKWVHLDSGGMFGMDLAWLLYHMQGLSTHIGVHDVEIETDG